MTATRVLLLACAVALTLSGTAAAKTSNDFTGHHHQVFPVYVVNGLTLGDLPQLAREGAVGVMVPNAGPRTSQAAAFAGMVRGILYNTRLPKPSDIVLIRVRHVREIPAHGLSYDPGTNRWLPLPPAPILGRYGPTSVWTGRELIVWGGGSAYPLFADGAAFTP